MSEIYIDLLSELIFSVPKTDKCSSDEIKRRTQLPWLQIQLWLSLFHLNGYLNPHTTWPRGLVVSVSGYETREPGSIPGCAPIFSVFFPSFFSILMLNCFILLKWHHQNNQNGHSWTFILNYAWNLWGWVKFGPPERELVQWPQIFILFSESYYNSPWNKK